MELSKIGEFGLIDLIRKKIYTKNKRVVLNIGDDAAVLRGSKNKLLVFTTDTLMEKVHFDLKYCSYRDVGWKSIAANLSDIAAMGGIPLAGIISLGVSSRTKVEDILKLYSGLKTLSSRFKCPVVGGGDIFSSKSLVITISLLGEVEKNLFKTRSGAKVGDLICVTGDLGEAEAGLRFLKKSSKNKIQFNDSITKKHLNPYPRIEESRLLVKNLKVTSMIDISDGLSSDLYHICEESNKGALIYAEKIPISQKTKRVCKSLNISPLSLALSSGEEYELLFTLSPEEQEKLRKITQGKFKVSSIGEIKRKEEGVKIKEKDGEIKDLKKTGYTHF
ncbi:MAG: thiamine-phosphate kinase [candidate division Zixibacteria bacterium]|nr:thiamine-phosphate kinase [candidate division Zixibacteria bacterium]